MQLPMHLKIGAGAAAAGVFGVLFGWVMFPAILKSQIKKEMALSKKTDTRAMWERIPFAMNFKVYMFNYTNPEEVQNGGIPIVKEIGPYHFDEWKEKVELEDSEENDTITYKKKDTFIFRPDLSGPGLTGEEIITMPHVVMISVATIVSKEKPKLTKTVGQAFNKIFEIQKDAFLRVKVLDILFRGFVVNCDQNDFGPKAVCTALKVEATNNIIIGPNKQYYFSIFGPRNGTIDPQTVTVKRGIKNIMDVGQVVALGGHPQIGLWRGKCDQFQGTDWTVFPPFLTEKDPLEVYFGDLCRNFRPWFQNKTNYHGIKTNRYVVNIGDLSNDPNLRCHCETDDTCPPKGLMSMKKCTNAPTFISLPHYLDSDPQLLTTVKGLNPDVNKHGIEIDFEPLSGTPMEAKLRVMFNMVLHQESQMELLRNLPNTMAPLFWMEEGLALDKDFVKMLKNQLFLPKKIVGALKWILVTIGIFGTAGSLIMHFKDDIMGMVGSSPGSSAKTKVNPETNQQKGISVIGGTQNLPKLDM
ncbi:unnamed protein product [Chilo suppressalis]|uniref:Sensory neuron membrane protein 1 n=1 Tax=Chilo suppressalis TaxID=168631 RepID=A0ABN8L666_CHISP|nr:unnamed protein product [Chilo suppressalis]